jgi:hypothetical protein
MSTDWIAKEIGEVEKLLESALTGAQRAHREISVAYQGVQFGRKTFKQWAVSVRQQCNPRKESNG